MILSCYPDYGKTSPEYIMRITETLATFPEWVLVEMCDLRTGVSAQCEFLPTVAAITTAGESIMRQRELLIEQQKQADEAEVKKQWQAEELADQMALHKQREAALLRAREKYKTAYLNAKLDLCYHSDIEAKVRDILGQPDPLAWLKVNKHTLPPRAVECLSWHGVSLEESPEVDMSKQVTAIVANATASMK
jgi:hypothetical protein